MQPARLHRRTTLSPSQLLVVCHMWVQGLPGPSFKIFLRSGRTSTSVVTSHDMDQGAESEVPYEYPSQSKMPNQHPRNLCCQLGRGMAFSQQLYLWWGRKTNIFAVMPRYEGAPPERATRSELGAASRHITSASTRDLGVMKLFCICCWHMRATTRRATASFP